MDGSASRWAVGILFLAAAGLRGEDLDLRARLVEVEAQAEALHTKGSLREAREKRIEALALVERMGEGEVEAGIDRMLTLAALERDMGRFSAARGLLERAMAVASHTWSPDDALSQHRLFADLGELMMAWHRFQDALPPLAKAHELSTRIKGEDHPDLVWGLMSLAKANWMVGDRKTALKVGERAFALARASGDPDRFRDAGYALAEYLKGVGRIPEAEKVLAQLPK